MKVLSLILPALAIATPLAPRADDSITPLKSCSDVVGCPLNYDCVYVDVACVENCKGYCYPNGLGFPTGSLPTATLVTNTGLPTATLGVSDLPTTNVVARATNIPRSKLSVDSEGEEEEDGDEEEEEELPEGYDEETLRIWGDKLLKYQPCGGFRPNPLPSCPKDYVCIDAPWGPECGMACDGPGICVKPVMCGGIAGFRCPGEDDICIDYPNDGCDPENGGRDCAGLCL